ncbi:MAG: MGMT family protein [Treponema sp.]|jgi:methylated-DNA-protein-cysteine methyltransferase-like protein|nr:MGMT family protein [Treponema sp.]
MKYGILFYIMLSSTLAIVKAIRSIPRGKVSCYRDLALAAGFPNGARQVVRVLHSLSEKEKLPWHRVIRADGSIALDSGQGLELQAALLRSEGVEVSKYGQVDMDKYGVVPIPAVKPRKVPHPFPR